MPEEAGQVKCRLVGQVCCRWWVRCAAGLHETTDISALLYPAESYPLHHAPCRKRESFKNNAVDTKCFCKILQ